MSRRWNTLSAYGANMQVVKDIEEEKVLKEYKDMGVDKLAELCIELVPENTRLQFKVEKLEKLLEDSNEELKKIAQLISQARK